MKIKVGVIFGGKSVEHEISVISAIQAIDSMNKSKYEVIPIYLTKSNEFYVGDMVGRIESYTDIDELVRCSTRVTLVNDSGRVKLIRYPASRLFTSEYDYIDVAFPIVHGTNVEDGTLQGYLKLLGVPYVGCDVLSSAVGMDKYVMKAVLKDNGVPVLDCMRISGGEYDDDAQGVIAAVGSKIGYPVIVKPSNLGSSIGISRADDEAQLTAGIETAFCYAQTVLIERCVENLKEINCSVCGDSESAEASECEQPLSSGEILDYSAKYLSNGSGAKGVPAKGAKLGGAKGMPAKGAKASGGKLGSGGSSGMASLSRKIPADITDEQRGTIRSLAVKAFKALGCSGVSRIDFMLDEKSGEIWLNEINTIPGSLSFYLWEPLGVSYGELIDKMISLCLKRERMQSDITYSFDTNVLQGASLTLGGAKGAKGAKL